MTVSIKPVYRRILLKLSGEILQGSSEYGIDDQVLLRMAKEVKELVNLDVQVGIVIGGGNFFRGSRLLVNGMHRVVADQMGMLATLLNGLAICNALTQVHVKTCLMSIIPINGICDTYNWAKAIDLLCGNFVVIFAAGTGNPIFTTDSAACLRGIEISADIVLKATKVDGVFSTDPVYYPHAILYDELTYQDVLDQKLKVMDLTAFTLAQDHNLPIRVFNINKPGILLRIVMGYKEGTLIT